MEALYEKQNSEANRHANDLYNNQLKRSSAGKSNGCFPASAKISTRLGKKSIEALAVGDHVISIDPKTGESRECEILKTKIYKNRRVISINFTDGSVLRTTKHHSLGIENNWRKVSSLSAGDKITSLSSNGSLTTKTINSISGSYKVEDVYNLITENMHNFIVDDVLAHNFTNFRTLQVSFWRLYCLLNNETQCASFSAELLKRISKPRPAH